MTGYSFFKHFFVSNAKLLFFYAAEQDPNGFKPFASSTCWIQGLYVYKEMRERIDESAYYGIPKDMDNDGLIKNKFPCQTESKFNVMGAEECVPMKKTFYLQVKMLQVSVLFAGKSLMLQASV